MQVIKTIFSILMVFACLLAVIFLFTREAFLYIALTQLKNDVVQIKNLHKRGQYIQNCISMGAEMIGNVEPYKMQIRFIDNKNYVSEVVCDGLDNLPITITQKQLPFFVEKQIGSAGIVWGEELNGVRLKLMGRVAELYLFNEEIISKMKDTAEELTSGPVTYCSGYGFSCCNLSQEQGSGKQLLGVKDCSNDCYEKCSFSPVILSFVSMPFFDQNSRQLQIKSGEAVSFSYTISSSQKASFDGQIEEEDDFFAQLVKNINRLLDKEKKQNTEEDQVQVIVDFGDGKQESLSTLNGVAQHSYICFSDRCEYLAKITAFNIGSGIKSAENFLSSIRVIVSN